MQLRQGILDYEVTAVFNLIGIRQFHIKLVAGLRDQCQRNQLRILVELSELAVQRKLHPTTILRDLIRTRGFPTRSRQQIISSAMVDAFIGLRPGVRYGTV
jgi:hypothetical protein